MAASCLADGYAYGRWQHVRGIKDGESLRERNELMECGPKRCTNASSSPCINWEFANSSCGHALTEARLCKALRCRNMLLVGDSTFLGLFRGLSIYAERQWQSGVMTNSAACPLTPQSMGRGHNYGLCGGCVNVSFWRHDHLLQAPGVLNSSRPELEQAAACDGWKAPNVLAQYPLLVLSRGAHVMEYLPELRPTRQFHAGRADALAEVLRPHLHANPANAVVYVKAHWGIVHSKRSEASAPLSKPEQPRDVFRWDLMPLISAVDVEHLQRALPEAAAAGLHHHDGGGSGALIVVDPTKAIAMRHDCRDNHLHVVPSVYLASTWRMIMNALAAV